MKDKKNKAKFNIFQKSDEIDSETKKSNIRVGYIDKKQAYVKNVSIKEAKRVAKDDPGKIFIVENREGVRYLNINEVIKLRTTKPKKDALSKDCNPVEGLKENNEDYSKKNPRIEFFGGGGVGIKANPVVSKDGKQLLSVDLIEGGFGFQYPPFAKFVDDRGFSTQGLLEVDLCGPKETEMTFGERDQFEDFEIVEEGGSIGFGRRYDADGRDIGEWDPTTYKNLGEDPIQRQIEQYLDALNRVQYPWWNSRGYSPLEVIGQDETTRIKYDVQHPTWGAKKDDGYVDIEFEVYGQGSDKNRDIRFRFVEVDDNDKEVVDGHTFTIKGITHQDRSGKTRKSIKRIKRKTTYKVISESRGNSQYKKDLILEQGLLTKSSFGQTGEEKKLLRIQNGDNYAQGSTIFADVTGSTNDNDDVQLTCPRGKFTAKNKSRSEAKVVNKKPSKSNPVVDSNILGNVKSDEKTGPFPLKDVGRGTFDLFYRLSERVPDPTKIRDSFMNQYAISPVPDSDEDGTDFAGIPYNFTWEENFPFSGDYIFRGSSDGESYLAIDGEQLFEMSGPNDSPKKYKKYIESGVHQIHVSLENGLKYEKEVTKVIRKDVEQDENTGSDYKIIYNDLNKKIMIKVSPNAQKVRLLDPDGIEVARLDIDSTKNGRMKFSEDGKKLIVGGKSNKQVDGAITFTWDDSRLINKSKSLSSIKIKDTLWDKSFSEKAIPKFISENFDLFMHGYAGDDLEKHNIQFKFEELNGNHKFIIDAKDYFDTGDNNDGVFSRNNFIEVKPNTNYIITISSPGNHETGLVKSFGRDPDELNPDSKIGSKITGNIIFRDFTGGSNDNDDFQARFQNGVVTSTRTAESEGRNSFSMVYRYNLSKDNDNITGTNVKTISLIDKNYTQKRESQYEIVKVEKGTKVEGQVRNIFDTVKYIDKANRKLWRIPPSSGKKDAFLNSYGIVPFKPKLELKSKSADVKFTEEIPDIKAFFDRDGDNLYLKVTGDGTATINFLLKVDDNQFDDDGLFAKEITIKTDDTDLKLKRESFRRFNGGRAAVNGRPAYTDIVKEKEKIRGSGTFTGGKTYSIKVIGGNPKTGFKPIDKTTVGFDDDITNGYNENGLLNITSINPKPIKVPVEVKIKEPTINDAEIESSSAEEIIAWKHVEFPVTGDYQIDVAAADAVNLYIGNSITDGDRRSRNGLSDVRDGGDEVIINKDGFNSAGNSTGMTPYVRRFEKGFYRIRAELIQSSNKSNSKKNPMGLAVKIKIINPQERVVSDASWQENPMGFAVTIDAPDPPIPSEEKPVQKGRCQNNPLWTTRFPGAEEQWYPVYDFKNPSRWSKFMNRFALSPFPPLSEENTDNGGDPRSNTWVFEAQETGYYGLKGSADNIGRITITDNETNKLKSIAETPNYERQAGDSLYLDLPEEGIGTLYSFRDKNPKTHIFKLEKGKYKIRVDVENYVENIKEKIEKVIFNTADWVSEPKKVNFANINFEKFGQGSNKNMEIKFIFQELGVKNGHTFTIKNVEKSGDIEKFKKKVKINTDYKVTAVATRKVNQQPKIKESKPKTSFEIPVSYNLDNPRNFGFKLLNGGKAIGFDDNATRLTNFGRNTTLREIEDFDVNATLKIESTSPGVKAKFSNDGKKIIVSGSSGGDLSVKFEWDDNPNTSGKVFNSINIGGTIFRQKGERGKETKKIKFGSDKGSSSATEQNQFTYPISYTPPGTKGRGPNASNYLKNPKKIVFLDSSGDGDDDNSLEIENVKGDIGVRFSDDMSRIIVTGHGKGSFDVVAEWDDNPSPSSNGEAMSLVVIDGVEFDQNSREGRKTKTFKVNLPDKFDPVKYNALEQGVLRKGFGKTGGKRSKDGAKEGGSSPGKVIFADYVSSSNDDNDMQIRAEKGRFTPSNRRGSIQTSSGDFKGRGTWDLTYRLEVSKTEEVEMKTELEGYEGVVYEGPKLATYQTGKLGPFLSPYFKDGVDTITGANTWTMIWKDVDFPIDGRYTLKAEADHILTVKVGGKEIEKIKSDQNVVKVKFTAPKGKNDIELKLKNEMKTGVPFKENPVLAAVQISGKIPTDTGSTQSWRQNPVGISAVLIPPPCKKVTEGIGVACNVKIKDPPIIGIATPTTPPPPAISEGSGTPPPDIPPDIPPPPPGISTSVPTPPTIIPPDIPGYPVILELSTIEIEKPGIGYTPGDLVILIPGEPGIPNIPLDAKITTSTSGGITSIKLNQNPFGITSYPKITIVSPEGLNFKGIPILRVIRDPIVQDTSKLIQVTDLVGLKKTGYYDGRPYYGSVFYKDGVKYAGWYETPGDLVQIYDTLQESIDAQVTTRPSAIIRQGSDIRNNDPRLNIPGTPDNLI